MDAIQNAAYACNFCLQRLDTLFLRFVRDVGENPARRTSGHRILLAQSQGTDLGCNDGALLQRGQRAREARLERSHP